MNWKDVCGALVLGATLTAIVLSVTQCTEHDSKMGAIRAQSEDAKTVSLARIAAEKERNIVCARQVKP